MRSHPFIDPIFGAPLGSASGAVLGAVLTGALIGLLPASSAVAGDVTTLYDVTFSAPTHAHGEPPTAQDGPIPRATVSDFSGDPRIRQFFSLGYLDLEPASGGVEAVTFVTEDLPSLPTYRIDIRAATILNDGADPGYFSVTLRFGNSVHAIRLTWSGTIEYVGSGVGTPELIGTWSTILTVPLTIVFDMELNTIDVTYDGEGLMSKTVADLDVLKSLATFAIGDAAVAVDRVTIAGGPRTVPVQVRSWSDIKALF